MPVTLTHTIIQFPTGGMTDRYLDKTEVVSVIYYSDNKQTHMFIFLHLHHTWHPGYYNSESRFVEIMGCMNVHCYLAVNIIKVL